MLRGDYGRARTTLLAAQAKDPANPYIQNNLQMLEESRAQEEEGATSRRVGLCSRAAAPC